VEVEVRERSELGKALKKEVCEIFKRFARCNGLSIKFQPPMPRKRGEF